MEVELRQVDIVVFTVCSVSEMFHKMTSVKFTDTLTR